MINRLATLGISVGFAALLAACGTGGSNPGTGGGGIYGGGAPATTSTPAASPATAASVIVTQDASLGPILTDAQGRTLYQFLPEKGGKIVCTGACLGPWPPFLASSVSAGSGVTGQLAVIQRPDSGQQVTYNTWPLYYFQSDTAPDQTKGQGIVAFGGKWLVATPGLQP